MLILDFSGRVCVYGAFARMSYAKRYKERKGDIVSAMIHQWGSGKDTWIHKPMASDSTWRFIHSFSGEILKSSMIGDLLNRHPCRLQSHLEPVGRVREKCFCYETSS